LAERGISWQALKLDKLAVSFRQKEIILVDQDIVVLVADTENLREKEREGCFAGGWTTRNGNGNNLLAGGVLGFGLGFGIAIVQVQLRQ